MITILYHDDHLVFVNKPHDLLSVPGKGPDNADCVLSRTRQQFPTARIVHRLDCATSGVMVLAQDADSHRELSRQFHDRETCKRYLADIDGHPPASQGECTHPLRCDWPNRPRQMVCWKQGKTALTHWQVLEQHSDHARVELIPHTGRSHQLRVHMLALGHPILGDRFYARGSALAKSSRLHLHAESLEITHPQTGRRLRVAAPCPF
ncbi:RluA family pseudouridine synthase [Motiliproteus sediminis]|uniref:RluA family pseudouridine synthase n=1 Tax=Motiliproteus sediminis TaxID=1468178 RepID=UPI001AEF79A4|nr:RluA family pseudouridine synthase [Motiliproteus sediminis]